jgi:predicted nucleic acid-binding protein
VIIVDTGVLVAAVNRRDRFHPSCAAFLHETTTVIATAERHGATKIATVDRKDFRIVTPTHCDAFELLPADLG